MSDHNKLELERQRLAQRLDDDVLASLRLLQAQTEAYRQALRHQPDTTMALTVLSSLVEQVMQRAQYLRDHLNPTVLDTLGLEPALEVFAADLQRVKGLTLRLQMARLSERLANELEIMLFRTIQTLINYAATHAMATHFDVQLRRVGEAVTIQYEDNGQWRAAQTRILTLLGEEVGVLGGSLSGQLLNTQALVVTIEIAHSKQLALTTREQEVLQWVAEGLTNKAIAAELSLSARTVSFHLDNVYSKLGVNTRTEAVMIALQRGWIENPAT